MEGPEGALGTLFTKKNPVSSDTDRVRNKRVPTGRLGTLEYLVDWNRVPS